jgi:hypothetical protein
MHSLLYLHNKKSWEVLKKDASNSYSIFAYTFVAWVTFLTELLPSKDKKVRNRQTGGRDL